MNFNKNNHNLIVVYEDEFLIVVNKQAGILTHAKSLKNDFSLINLLLDNNITLCKGENILRPGVVHRLDKETSGLIVFAKTDNAYLSLKQQFYQNNLGKTEKVLLENQEDGYHYGFTENYVKVKLPIEKVRKNEIVNVKLNEINSDLEVLSTLV